MKAAIILFTFTFISLQTAETKSLENMHNSRVRRQISSSSASASASSGGSSTGSNYGGGGFQLNDFLAQLPFLNQQRYSGYYDDYDYYYGPNDGYRYSNYPSNPSGNYYPSGNNFPSQGNFPARTNFASTSAGTQSSQFGGAGASVSDLARVGGAPGAGRSFTSFTSSNVNGVQSASGVQVDPQGRVSTFRSGPQQPNVLTTRNSAPGQVNGVFSSSSVNVGPDGKVKTNQDSGHF